jgi:HSP20 family molecular chaperone IbpA
MNSDISVRTSNGPAGVAARADRRTASPHVDVLENAEEVLVVADIPGVRGEDVDVRVENDTLTLETRRGAPAGAQQGPALLREYDEVDYTRAFRIPAGIDVSQVSAETKNGTLTVRLPKSAAAKARKISVQSS